MRRGLLAASIALGGCSYPEFAFAPEAATTADEGVETTADDTSVVDAGGDTLADSFIADTLVSEASTTDSFVADTFVADSSMTDTSVTDTAPADAGPSGCAVPHDFCASFDTATAPADGWSSSYVAAGGALSLDKTVHVSPSTSLSASVPTSGSTAAAMVARNFTVKASTDVITIEADVRLDSLAYAGPGHIIILKVQRSSAGDGVSLTVGAGLFLEAQGSTTVRYPVTGVTAGKWFHVRMEAVLHTTAGRASLWIDGASKVSKTALSTAEVDDTSRQLIAGLFAYTGASPFRARYDDVALDWP